MSRLLKELIIVIRSWCRIDPRKVSFFIRREVSISEKLLQRFSKYFSMLSTDFRKSIDKTGVDSSQNGRGNFFINFLRIGKGSESIFYTGSVSFIEDRLVIC